VQTVVKNDEVLDLIIQLVLVQMMDGGSFGVNLSVF
jgi:hypothetical protein